jgi:Flp pilus assembly pilin Flp
MLVRLYAQSTARLQEFRSRLHEKLVDWTGSERGGVAAEYALLVALIAVFITAGAFLLGQAINTRLTDTATCVGGAPAPC